MGLNTAQYFLLSVIREYIEDGWYTPFTYSSLSTYISVKKKKRYEPQTIEREIRRLVQYKYLSVEYRVVWDSKKNQYVKKAYFTPTDKFYEFFNKQNQQQQAKQRA